ncbi:CcmD family protein [Hymenobacter taeanensis]|uniref:CcmD family protein n=1 Tax=Hymenobacter taeanensis TaxID=2735321 RepID=A0A6M6BGT2_9BACT|nr:MULTISPECIES: CcmD family protein [Hymenobacter]QJX47239.1 CcmD family protein [Hymenobacter taeanensis]UOQ79424.1 CcmD family protein [Hymenobacter sp. 5414T-23]
MKNSLPKLRPALLLLLALLLPMLRAAAQATASNEPEMADALRHDGKIYVVVAVITVVLAGLLFFLISLDRKLSRLEKEVKD